MTGDPQPMTSATETARGLAAQIQDVRDVLRNDAVAAGIDVDRVDAAVDAALASYTEARVPRLHRSVRRTRRPSSSRPP